MEAELKRFEKPPEKTVQELFERLNLLEKEETKTQCLGEIKEKNFLIHEKLASEEKIPIKTSKFKQEMANKKK